MEVMNFVKSLWSKLCDSDQFPDCYNQCKLMAAPHSDSVACKTFRETLHIAICTHLSIIRNFLLMFLQTLPLFLFRNTPGSSAVPRRLLYPVYLVVMWAWVSKNPRISLGNIDPNFWLFLMIFQSIWSKKKATEKVWKIIKNDQKIWGFLVSGTQMPH